MNKGDLIYYLDSIHNMCLEYPNKEWWQEGYKPIYSIKVGLIECIHGEFIDIEKLDYTKDIYLIEGTTPFSEYTESKKNYKYDEVYKEGHISKVNTFLSVPEEKQKDFERIKNWNMRDREETLQMINDKLIIPRNSQLYCLNIMPIKGKKTYKLVKQTINPSRSDIVNKEYTAKTYDVALIKAKYYCENFLQNFRNNKRIDLEISKFDLLEKIKEHPQVGIVETLLNQLIDDKGSLIQNFRLFENKIYLCYNSVAAMSCENYGNQEVVFELKD